MLDLWLYISLAAAFGTALASVLRDVWRDYRSGRRSLATALAITCITAGMPVLLAATALEQGGPAELVKVLQVVGIALVFAGGSFGAVGLVLDRRLRRAAVAQPADRS